MKNFLIFIVLLVSFSCFGQAKFKLFGHSPCSNEVKEIKYFGLRKGGDSFNTIDTSGIVLLKDTGVYILSYVLDKIDDSELGKKYYVKSTGDLADTLRILKITPCIETSTRANFNGYCCCDKKCEGRQIDYYENGSKRIEGNFVEGKPVGKLIFYDSKGNVQEVHKYNGKGRLVKKSAPR